MILAIIIGLTVVGAVNAVAAVGAFYRENRKQGDAQPPGTACRSVFQTRQARMLGLPNGVVGLIYYVIAAGVAVAAAAGAPRLLADAAATAALIAAAFSIYLTHLLVFRLRMSCRICHTGNAINVVLAILWAAAADWLQFRR